MTKYPHFNANVLKVYSKRLITMPNFIATLTRTTKYYIVRLLSDIFMTFHQRFFDSTRDKFRVAKASLRNTKFASQKIAGSIAKEFLESVISHLWLFGGRALIVACLNAERCTLREEEMWLVAMRTNGQKCDGKKCGRWNEIWSDE